MQRTTNQPTHKLIAQLSAILLLVLAIFIVTLTFKIGFDLVQVFQAAPVEAAPDATATVEPTLPPTTGTVSVTEESTPLPPTSTPIPTSTPVLTATPMPTPVPEDPYLVAGDAGVNVRSGPGLDYTKIDLLMPGDQAPIAGYHGDWWAVKVNDQDGWVYKEIVTAYAADSVVALPAPPPPTPESTPVVEATPVPVWALDEARWIDVDLSEQRLTAYERQTAVKTYLVSTGLPQTPTPLGQYRIWIKFEKDDMAGADYYIKDVPWVMYFHQGYGLHGVTWHANFGHRMSHGCVNQPNDMAEWLFHFAKVGTLVNIHE